MNEKTLYDLLVTLNIHVAYDHFEQSPSNKIVPPFILYRNTDSFTKKAEDRTWARFNNYIVDLVTETKNPDLEQSLEDLFYENCIPFDKEENYLDDERIYEIRYFIC